MAICTSDDLRRFVARTIVRVANQSARASLQNFVDHQQIKTNVGDVLQVDEGDMWLAVGDRTLGRYTNSFLFARQWLPLLHESSPLAKAGVRDLLGLVRVWNARHGEQSSGNAEMAFHDETTAQRLLTLTGLYYVSTSLLSSSEREFLEGVMVATSDLLLTDDFHATGNNHGMFQDIALRNYSLLSTWEDPAVEQKLATSLKRLSDYFRSSFTADGVHIENSPSYHLMTARILAEHQKIVGMLPASAENQEIDLSTMFEAAGRYATHAVLPTGTFVPISDTKQNKLSSPALNEFESDEFEYDVTQGRSGTAPASTMLSLPESGYFYARSAWGEAAATFVSFTAAYNGHYHKHSDDLSVLIWCDGKPLLTEAGPFGYDYELPLTKYAFGQYAHNNVVVNGASVPRTDSKASSVVMGEVTSLKGHYEVVARTGRLRGCTHERKLRLDEEFRTVVIDDALESEDENQYDAHWNFAPDIDVVVRDYGFALFREQVQIADVRISASHPVTISVHRGELAPTPLGWSFPDFGKAEPAPCVRVRLRGANAQMATTFTIAPPFSDGPQPQLTRPWNEVDGLPDVLYRLEASADSVNALVVHFSDDESSDRLDNFEAFLQRLHAPALFLRLPMRRSAGAAPTKSVGHAIEKISALIHQHLEDLAIPPGRVVTVGVGASHVDALFYGVMHGAAGVVGGLPGGLGEIAAPPKVSTRSDARATSEGPIRIVAAGVTDQRPAGVVDLARVDLWDPERTEVVWGSLNDEVIGTVGSAIRHAISSFVAGKFQSVGEYGTNVAPHPKGVQIQFPRLSGYQFGAELFRRDAPDFVVSEKPCSSDSTVRWDNLPAGRYRVRITGKSGESRLLPFTTPWVDVA